MRRVLHILAVCVAAAALAGCAEPVLDKYMGRSIVDPMLDFGQPDEVFDLADGQRAFQWQVEKYGMRPSPNPVIGVGIGVGGGGWGNLTTIGTSYEPFITSCRYTLIGTPRGKDWIVTARRKPAPGCQ